MIEDTLLEALCAAVPGPDMVAAAQTQVRLDSLTKPQGSLGELETLLVRLAASSGQPYPTFEQRAILLAAADHGVAAEGVSAYPQAVTTQMVQNYLKGGAAINVLANAAGARLIVVDAGIVGNPNTLLPNNLFRLQRLNLRRGSGNMLYEPAMTHYEALRALLAGVKLVEEEWKKGLDLLAVGEMGIANTTPAAALTSAFTGEPPMQTVGRGTGIDDGRLEHKRNVVDRALQRVAERQPLAEQSAVTLLAELGGLEIAVLVGAMLAAGSHRIPVLLDGYITTSAALVAVALAPNLRHHLIASHRSAEPGHALALAQLGLTPEAGAGPLLQLGLRLGEGSGAALALPLILAATQLLRDMATFEQAGVARRSSS